jgi:N-acyl-phosphatidylethanolamine-hydrolysing phospholipase D
VRSIRLPLTKPRGESRCRLNRVYWLIDPIFSERAFLPKRVTPPAITAEALKQVAPNLRVIITRNHYDHLDKPSILDLPQNTRMYVPLSLKAYIEGLGKEDVREMDWWQEIDCGNGITLVCLPAQHWSRRLGQGVNETLWASYMLITPQVTIYVGGDTGYFVGHKEIGKRYPKIDYALLPTTAYHPRWFMHYNHMNVDEAIEAFGDLNARFMIPHQWGDLSPRRRAARISYHRAQKKDGRTPPRYFPFHHHGHRGNPSPRQVVAGTATVSDTRL